MIIGILGEGSSDNRVAATPEHIPQLLSLKAEKILVEAGAGIKASYPDSDYVAKGAEITDRQSILNKADMLLCINPLPASDLNMLDGKVLIGGFNPLVNTAFVKECLSAKVSAFSLDVIPRTTRAQAMDILSSMATVSGYKAVLMAATHLPKFFPMFMTAAGTITPAKILVLGAGVAGLQAISTAKRLGGVVEASDVRQASREEVLSLGAKFVDVEGATEDKSAGGYAVEQSEEFKKRQQETVQEHAAKSDVIICTAQIPGRKAPILIQKETVEKMKPGSVIVDLAASTGGNCELTENGKIIQVHGVTIIGDSGLASTMPYDASKMFGKNIINFLKIMIDKEGNINLNWEDDLITGTCISYQQEIKNERVKNLITVNA
ncbi:MAG: NAD(P) transhydrogenase subunit alpha [Chitinophagales bacterium]|nr:NAD(P) transhydrogenase subunit alpha [Chitinophagales bacterium]MBP9188432.1 NAD(P) transhydrogenase subunit alpha [Chitinophagales bacterium]MBP9549650.1 NAD(P) transhydrogenase subunit alpha [Chitinophagales bacterium]MBP9703312.1 NAD(P) transhydrogenase subunit alpha [Chitinophagales bacterium]